MWASKSLGVALGGGGGTVLAKHLGWSTLFVVMALCMRAIMLFPRFIRERPPADDDGPIDARLLKLTWLWSIVRDPRRREGRSRSRRRGGAWPQRRSPRRATPWSHRP